MQIFILIEIKTLFFFLENEKSIKFMYGYHSSQIPLYSLADSERFVTILISAFRQIFQYIVIIFVLHEFV